MKNIPITKPCFTEEDKKAIIEPLMSGWIVQGPNVAKFEKEFSNYTKSKFSLATTSCTTALHIALVALNIKEGDEVIVPSFTFVATANVVEYQKAVPIFVDIDIETFNISPKKIEEKITRRTKAIIPVHLFGLCADMDEIMYLAKKHNLKVIEDAACALGSLYNGKHAGTFGDAGCFSFHPRKIITTGEGGMVITNDAELYWKVKSLRDHGAMVSDLERHKKGEFALPEYNMVGYNYRMTDIQGALGVAQIKKLDMILRKRRELAQRYNEELKDIEWLSLPKEFSGYRHGYQSYVVLVKEDAPFSRDELALKFIEKGVSVRQGTHAVHTLGYYCKKYNITLDSFPQSLKAHNQSLALPLYFGMTDEEQDFVISILKKQHRKGY
jgi:dTDP-4-amino-4,6-dideoxygalactose transaminase